MFMEDLKEPGEKIEVNEYKGERLVKRGVAKEISNKDFQEKKD